MSWLNNKTEWTGTEVVWEITNQNDPTQISMTHIGLSPEVECYLDCERGWDYYLKESLAKLLAGEKGLPNKIKVNI